MLFRVEQCFLELTHREEIFSCSYRELFRHHRDDDVHLLTVRTHPEYIKHNATEFRVRWFFIALTPTCNRAAHKMDLGLLNEQRRRLFFLFTAVFWNDFFFLYLLKYE